MNKTYLCIFILFFSMFMANKGIFSQGNIETGIGIYNGKEQEYFKKKLKIYYKPERMNDQSYLSDVNNFVTLRNGSIDSIYSQMGFIIGIVTFTSPTSDALLLIDEFIQSNLFQYVLLRFGIKPSGFDIPNDPLFYNQNYLKQTINPGGFNHDIDANKAWWVTLGDASKVSIYIVDTGIRLSSNNANSTTNQKNRITNNIF